MVRKLKSIDEKIKRRRETKLIEKKSKKNLFIILYKYLENFMSKSSKKTFENYLKQFKNSINWTLVSDYSFYSKNDNNNSKKSNVYSYTLIPFLPDENFIKEVKTSIKKDIKKVNFVSEKTQKMLKNEYFFTFNFITEVDYLEDKLPTSRDQLVNHRKEIEKTIEEINKKYENNVKKDFFLKSLKNLSEKLKEKRFNFELYRKILINSFFASYISFLLESQIQIKSFLWISDQDSMTEYIPNFYKTFYMLEKDNFRIINKLNSNIIEFSYIQKEKIPFYNPLISIPDYFCGILAEYKIDDNKSFDNVCEKEKYNDLFFKVLKDNKNILNIILKKDLSIARLNIGKNSV